MKKFFITFLILILLAGTAFFFGWANLEVPPGSYGVIASKTHGVDPKIVQAGEFRWLWYKLIPTNVKISVFRLEQQQFPINFDSSLPSGDIYAEFVGLGSSNFSWELKGHISFAINPDHLVNITSQNNIKDQAELDSFMQEMSEKIKLFILYHMRGAEAADLERFLSGTDHNLELALLDYLPSIRDFLYVPTTVKFPDFALYHEIRAIYEDFLAKQREYITSSFGQKAENHIQSQLTFSELEKYGELLTKYPILLDYLALKEGR